MGILLLIGFSQVALSVWFTYKEIIHFYSFIKMEVEDKNKWRITLPFRCVKHLPKTLPILADIVLAVFLSSFMGMGAGIVGGVTGMFASNCVSGLIYYHTHIKKNIGDKHSLGTGSAIGCIVTPRALARGIIVNRY